MSTNVNAVDSSVVSATKKYKKRSQIAEIWRRFCHNRGALIGLAIVFAFVFVAVFADVILDYETDVIGQNIAERMQKPSWEHPFGTDEVGRDIFCRVLYGTRTSLSVGGVSTLISLVIGVTLGCIAGYFGGLCEDIIMRATDICGSIPNILMGIAIVSALGVSTANLMLALGFTGISGLITDDFVETFHKNLR